MVNIGLEGPLGVALPKLVRSVYGAGPGLLGTLETMFAVGAIIAALLLGQVHRPRHRGILAYSALMGAIFGLITLGVPFPLAFDPVIASFACILIGFGLSFFGIIWTTVLQELVPEDKLGRVSSIDWLCSFGLTPVGLALTGILTDGIGPSLTFILGGTLGLIMVSMAFCVPAIRHLE